MPHFRSKLEERVAKVLDKQWIYEPRSFPYTTERRYTPDFVEGNVWLEVKGYFRPGDTAKYKAIALNYLGQKRLIFVFEKPHQPVRKGAKLTMAGWAEKNGWEWTTPSAIEEEGI